MTTQVELAKRWRWNRKTVIFLLRVLKQDQIVDISTVKGMDIGHTLITICNWNKFQASQIDAFDISPDISADRPWDISGTLVGHYAVNNKNDKERRNGKEKREEVAFADANASLSGLSEIVFEMPYQRSLDYKVTGEWLAFPITRQLLSSLVNSDWPESEVMNELEWFA